MNYIGFRKPFEPRARAAATLALLLALAAPGCRPTAGGTKPITLIDDAGDTVRLAAPPRRIVSLNPVFTELVFALGAGDRLVGRTSQCDFPAEAARVPDPAAWGRYYECAPRVCAVDGLSTLGRLDHRKDAPAAPAGLIPTAGLPQIAIAATAP